MTNCKYITKNGRCGLKDSYAYRHGCFGEDMCRCREPMTNADRIRNMSDDELAEFLDQIAYARETPWSKPFYEKFCKSCPEPEYTLDDGRELRLHECDFKDGVCPHGGDIVWWLQQPAEEAQK